MTRGEFDKLTERYRAGRCSGEEIAFVEKWMDLNGRHADETLVFETEAEAQETEADIWAKIRDEAGIVRQHKIPALYWKWISGAAAACLAVLLVVNFLPQERRVKYSGPAMTGLETYNTSSTSLRIVLPDSSVVTLAEGASIITSENYGQDTRTVRLTGEAFFDIRSNPKMPFLVYSGDLVTEVLGTSFTIKPETARKTIEVSVIKGKVSVYTYDHDRNKRRSGVIITPNQKAVYNTDLKTIRHDLVDEPKMVVKDAPASAFKFDETPVGTVLSVLQKAYGMEIVVNNPELNDCEFTGNLNGFDLFKQLSYLCDVLDAQYEVRGTTIFLTGRGCQEHDANEKLK